MGDRRAVFPFGVSYDTPTDVLAAIPAEVRKIVEAHAIPASTACHLLTYGDTALQFELVYFVTKPDFAVYADTQQAINLALLDRLRDMKVQLARRHGRWCMSSCRWEVLRVRRTLGPPRRVNPRTYEGAPAAPRARNRA